MYFIYCIYLRPHFLFFRLEAFPLQKNVSDIRKMGPSFPKINSLSCSSIVGYLCQYQVNDVV